jgi:hypothetical protein
MESQFRILMLSSAEVGASFITLQFLQVERRIMAFFTTTILIIAGTRMAFARLCLGYCYQTEKKFPAKGSVL